MNEIKTTKVYDVDDNKYIADNIHDVIKLHEAKYGYEPVSIKTVYLDVYIKAEPTFEMVCDWLKKNADKYCLPKVKPSDESEKISVPELLISRMCTDFEKYFNEPA